MNGNNFLLRISLSSLSANRQKRFVKRKATILHCKESHGHVKEHLSPKAKSPPSLVSSRQDNSKFYDVREKTIMVKSKVRFSQKKQEIFAEIYPW